MKIILIFIGGFLFSIIAGVISENATFILHKIQGKKK